MEKLKSKKVGAIVMVSVLMLIMVVGASAAEAVKYEDFSAVITGLQSQISVGTIVELLAALVGVTVGLVFMWWGVRKVVGAIMSAFRNGRLSL